MPVDQTVADLLKPIRPGVERLTAALQNREGAPSLSEIRALHAHTMTQSPSPGGVRVEEVDMGGVPSRLLTPDDVIGDRIVLFMHGGAYLVGSSLAYLGLASAFAKALKSRVYIPDYRLAPEFPFPTPIEDVFSSYRWLLAQGHDPQSISFVGDSAGGAMTVSVMVMARNAGLPLPAAGAALSPWANLEHSGESMSTREGLDPINTKVALDAMARAFLGDALANNPEASPVFADVRGLPPILIQMGEAELMLSDGIRLASHLATNRVRVTLEVWPEMFHVWHMYESLMPEGAAAIANAATFLDQAMSATSNDRGTEHNHSAKAEINLKRSDLPLSALHGHP